MGFSWKPYHVHILVGLDTPNWLAVSTGMGTTPMVTSAFLRTWNCNHLHVVHLVDVVAREDQGIAGHVLLEGIDVLEDCIGRTLIPAVPDALLCRYVIDELSHGIGKEGEPALLDVAVQGVGFVLGEHINLLEA